MAIVLLTKYFVPRTVLWRSAVVTLFLSGLLFAQTAPTQTAAQSYGRIPMTFEENSGQSASDVKFVGHGPGYLICFYADHVTFRLRNHEGRSEEFQMSWARTNAPARVSGTQPVITTSNYLIGSDRKLWRTGIRNFGAVQYDNLAPGISLVFRGKPKEIEYDILVEPGADPSKIAFDLRGLSRIKIDHNGDLILSTRAGTMIQRKPIVYQQSGADRRIINARYVLSRPNRVQFKVGAYDPAESLVIDPVLSYSTYIGGAGDDAATAIAVDADGNAYITGSTMSSNFPLLNPKQATGAGGLDAFVAKLNPSGTALIYSTYLGGGFDDSGLAIAVDSARNAYITGSTCSQDFPTTPTSLPFHASPPNFICLGFVSELSANGSTLVFSSYLGVNGPVVGYSIALDSANNIYVGGSANTEDSLGTAGSYQPSCHGYGCGFIAKIGSSGSNLAFWTYLGASSAPVVFKSIGLDPSGNVFVTGYTTATDFPTTPGAFQTTPPPNFYWNHAFATKFKADGSGLIYSTYLRGSLADYGRSIAVNALGNAYVSGDTSSSDFPVTGTIPGSTSGNIFVTKLNPTGTALVYSVLFGSNGAPLSPFQPAPQVTGIVLDPSQNVIVAGGTSAPDFPITGDDVQSAVAFENRGFTSGFVSKLNATGTALLYSTILGEPSETAAVTSDTTGNIYVAGTASYTFPATPNAFQTTSGGGVAPHDAFVAKIDLSRACAFSISPLMANVDAGGGSVPVTITASDGCTWAVVSPTAWVQADSYTGAGNGTTNLHILPNAGAVRTATISVAGNPFAITQGTNCTYNVTYTPASLNASGGDAGSFSVSTQGYCAWTASSSVDWLQVSYYNAYGGGAATVTATSNINSIARTGNVTVAGQVFTITQPGGPVLTISKTHMGVFRLGQNGTYQVQVTNALNAAPTSGVVTVTDSVPYGMTLFSMSGSGWTCPGTAANNCNRSDVLNGGNSYPAITVTVNIAGNAPPALPNHVTVSGGGSGDASADDLTTINPPAALQYVPITPCRIADTRITPNGPFSGPSLAAFTSRDFVIPSSSCGIPANAVAYSMNITVVPSASLGFLTVWPSGQPRPLASTLNALDARTKANAVIVEAGTGGAVSFYANGTTDLVIDIYGYFVTAGSSPAALVFNPLTPCRIADTRSSSLGTFGSPSLIGRQSRTFSILSSGCSIPPTAQAYSLNFTAVPPGPFGFLTAWPTGQTRPLTSVLNDLTGTIVANAAIVPAGTNGSIDVFANGNTDLIIDINGYFAPPAVGGLSLYPLPPCRVLDTRLPSGSPPFSGERDVNVGAAGCGAATTSQAFVFNATVVPPAALGFLTLWPQGTRPIVSTLNALDGQITSNMAIVPTLFGSVSTYANALTHLILDLYGYFAP